jgi:hypothetical protein
MATNAIRKTFEICKDCLPGLLPRGETSLFHTLAFERTEKLFLAALSSHFSTRLLLTTMPRSVNLQGYSMSLMCDECSGSHCPSSRNAL